jgi:hypothetical protein
LVGGDDFFSFFSWVVGNESSGGSGLVKLI